MSHLENQFTQLWLYYFPEIDLFSEYKFSKKRKFRADFAHPQAKVIIEIQGGIWQKSGHSSGKGITRDAEKLNLATAEGWAVFFLPESLITEEQLQAIAQTIKSRLSEK